MTSMTESSVRTRIRAFVREALAARKDGATLDDNESLFVSGRLESLAVTQLVVFLEESFGVDFGVTPFELDELDSVELITRCAEANGRKSANNLAAGIPG